MASELLYLGLLFTITITCVYCEGVTNESEVILVPAPYRIIVLDQKAPLLINCSVNITGSIQLYNYTWRKDSKLIEENRRKARVRDAERKKLKDLPRVSQFSIFPNGSLYLPNGFLSLHGVKNTTKNRKLDGVYECIVNTSKGATLARKVKVVSASIAQTFHVQPVSTEAYKGGVARFECKISSEPSTTYIWHKDDKEAHDPRYTVLPSGVLQISDVQQTDEGTYWCQAASQPFTVQENAGYSWKQSRRANLRVKSSTENRLDILAAPLNTAVVVGETAFIECLVDGYPKPKITWRKIQSKMLKPEIIQNFTSQHIYGPGNLRLMDVTSDHAGLYECTIIPSQGEPIRRTAILDVLEPPKVEQGPESYSAPVSKSQHLFCKVSGNPTPVITWYHNGTNVDDNLTMFPKDFNSQRNNLVLYFQQIAHSGYYVCVAENSVGQYIGSAFGNVYLTSAAAAQPVNVKIFPLNSTTVNVTWQQPGASDIKTYVVNYQVVELSRPNQQQLCPGQTQYCVLHGLMPFTNYSVSIAAFTSSGSSLVTKMQYVKTPEDVPLAAPSITISSPKPNTMLVSWTPLTLSQSRGIVTGYKVYYRKKDRDGEFPDDVAADQTSYIIANLEPSVTYEVLVLAVTKAGFPKSDQQAWTSFTMPSLDGGPGSTENSDGNESRGFKISAYNVTANSVTLEWHPDISRAGYEICYHIFDLDKSTETCLESKNNLIVITDLESFTKYLFRVQPLNFDDDFYSEIYVKTKEAMSSPPLNVTVEVINARSVMLTWLPPAEPHGDISFYHLLYSKETSEPAQMSWKTITEKIAEDKKVQSASVADLEPGTYFFKVAAVNPAGEGMHSDNQSVVIKCYDTVHFCVPPISNTEAPDISSVQQKSSVTFIVGIVVGLFLLALLIFMSVYCWKRRSASRELDPNSNHAPIYRGNGHISSLSNHQSGQKPGNGHAHLTQGNGSGDFGHDNSHSPESTPMLQKLSENEQSDSKGPPGLIIQNGLRSNGIIKTNHKSPGQIVISRSGDPNSSISSEELQLLMVTTTPVPTAGSHSMEMVPMSTLDDIDRIDEEQGDHSSEDSGTGCRRAGMPCGEHHLSGSSLASSPGGNSLHRQRTWEKGRQGDEFGGVFIDSSTGAAIKLLGDCIEEKKKVGEGCYDDDSANDQDSGHGSEVKSHIGIQSSENHSLSPKTGTSLRTSVPQLFESNDLGSTGQREDRISHNPSAVLVASTQSVSPPPSQQLPHLSSRNLFNSNRPHNGHRQHQRGVRQHSDLPPPPPPPPHLSSQTLPHHQNLQAAGPASATTAAEAINTSSSREEGENLSNGLGSILFRQLEGKTAVAFSPPRPPPSPPNIA
ncbi:immunoglobulin superfamily DCC subclass member 4 [Biomphalaria pfeifferi]|uniref:Immunoglobulin superfamily DCC subclass member 4 n=1 Tax=Biomphalaria pfeifferi TaxID=112525 RepID=A0AAD8B2R7_BIOPF|nr:immunoglobulin superfamily DCC subclass member 4 [Biomphalaria pfeifferi]